MADEGSKFNKGLDAVKGRGRPLGGAPEVSIPPLNADPIEGGGSMHEQAAALRDPANPLSPNYNPQAAQQEQHHHQMDPQALRAGRTVGQTAGALGQMLTPEQQQDPRFRPGIGSAYAANQPQLQQPPPGQPGSLSEETKGGLDAIARFQEKAELTQQQETEAKTEDQIKASDEELSKKFMKDNLGIENPEEFFAKYNEEMDQLQDPALKKAIEDRCIPLDLVQLLEEGEARQDVPIVPGKFIVTFRTISGEEDLEIKRLLFGVQSSDQYAYDLLSMYQLTAGLFSINNRKIPTHLNDDRGFDKEKFNSKFRLLRKYPMAMLASMSVNFGWFDRRTRALFVDVEGLKNG
jgi:hypothetical protein